MDQQKIEGALRDDGGKARFDLLPADALEELARVYAQGAKKYAPDNWALGMSWRRCLGSLLRHAFKWSSGEDIDKESGCHHAAHIAWNALTLVAYARRGVGTDDRYKTAVREKDPDEAKWTSDYLERLEKRRVELVEKKAPVVLNSINPMSDKPLAAKPYLSFRYKGRYGWIMIGAMDVNEALREASRSMDCAATIGNLETWDEGRQRYVPVLREATRSGEIAPATPKSED